MTKKKTFSLLGSDSARYDEFCPRTGHIIDEPENGRLIMRPAGFTKQDDLYAPRQVYFKSLYDQAVARGTVDECFPVLDTLRTITLSHERNNKHDCNALRILMQTTFRNQWGDNTCKTSDLGYVPKRINIRVLRQIHKIRKILIYSVEKEVHGKYFVANLCLVYGEPVESPEQIVIDRMAAVME